jgi:hypothetical protein
MKDKIRFASIGCNLLQDTDMQTSRRQFIIYSTAGLASLTMAGQAQAQAMLGEAEPTAVALGYKADAKTVDKAKWSKYADGQVCTNCQLYASKSADAGTCSIFPGKLVAGPGWCNAWIKKA